MLENPAERTAVECDDPFESVFRGLVKPALLGFRLVPQEPRTHHRRQRQRYHRRNQNGDTECDRKFAEQAADDVGHEQQGNQNGDQRYRQRNNREADLGCAFQRGIQGSVPFLDVTMDVFDHDNGVVDHETGRDGHRHQGQVVQAVSEQIHHAERADERERNGNARDHRSRQRSQEEKNDENNEDDGQNQLELDILDRGANGVRPVRKNGNVDRGRYRVLQLRKQGFHAVNNGDGVRTGLALNVDDDCRRQVHPCRLRHVFHSVDHIRNIRQLDRRAVPIGEHKRLVQIAFEKLIVSGDRVCLSRPVEVALRLIHIGGGDYVSDILQSQPIPRQLGGIYLNANGGFLAAGNTDQTDAR